jgi:hypothetical protein
VVRIIYRRKEDSHSMRSRMNRDYCPRRRGRSSSLPFEVLS